MKADFMNISGGCDIHSPDIEYEIPGVQDITILSVLTYDGRNDANNIDFSLNVQVNPDNYLDFSLINTGTRRSIPAQEILAPEKTQDFNEFLDEVYTDIYSDYDYGYYDDYEYTSSEHDEYSEDCYIYDSGDSTCYKYYDDKTETCEYIAESDKTNCDTYDYGYKIIETQHDEYSQTCYSYDS
jgi:hypothetical protein